MQDLRVPTITFKDPIRGVVPCKDMREYPAYIKATEISITNDDRIDEIAQRPEIYGKYNEDMSYMIVDFNIDKLYEEKFDTTKLKTLGIPNAV